MQQNLIHRVQQMTETRHAADDADTLPTSSDLSKVLLQCGYLRVSGKIIIHP